MEVVTVCPDILVMKAAAPSAEPFTPVVWVTSQCTPSSHSFGSKVVGADGSDAGHGNPDDVGGFELFGRDGVAMRLLPK